MLQKGGIAASIASQPPVSFVTSPTIPSDALMQCSAMEAQIENLSKQRVTTPTSMRRLRQDHHPKWDRSARRYNNTNYCWSDGCDINDRHTSMNCKHKKPSHIESAIINDAMAVATSFVQLLEILPAPHDGVGGGNVSKAIPVETNVVIILIIQTINIPLSRVITLAIIM